MSYVYPALPTYQSIAFLPQSSHSEADIYIADLI